MSRFQVRQDLVEKRPMSVGRNRANEGLRPGERLGRIGRHGG